MKKIILPILAGALVGAPLAQAQSAEETLTQQIGAACLEATSETNADCLVETLERRAITAEVALYRFEVRVGTPEHDRIALYRVVRETAPFSPIHTGDAILMAHGDRWGFQATFLTSLTVDSVADTRSIAVFLAENGVDVWGMDFRWAVVPPETADVSFMADWGLGTDLGDMGLGLAVARSVRLHTGSGYGQIHLAGFSRGGQTAYAYLGEETQRPEGLRHSRGFLAFDIFMKTDVEELRLAACQRTDQIAAQIDSGNFVSNGAIFKTLGDLAVAQPNKVSPFFPPFTNLGLVLVVGAEGDADDVVPFFHAVGGIVGVRGAELLYTPDDHYVGYFRQPAFFEPRQLLLEAEQATCGEDSPYDDHLSEITVPVLYVGAGGAFGDLGIYNTTILGSSDVSSLVVQLQPDEQKAIDFGHNDLFLATDAETLVWQGVLSWIESH